MTKHISLSSVLNVSLWTIFPLLKNRWAKHDLVIFYSFMNMFSWGYNNLLFNFNCFKWMQWIQLYNKHLFFIVWSGCKLLVVLNKWELRNLRRLSHSQLICSTIYKLCREGRKILFFTNHFEMNFNCWQTAHIVTRFKTL